MKLLLYGVNQLSAGETVINQYILSESKLKREYEMVSQLDGVDELIIQNGPTYTEYYFLVDEKQFKHGEFIAHLGEKSDREIEEVILDTYSKFNDDLISHLISLLTGQIIDLPSTDLVTKAEESSLCSPLYSKNYFLNHLFKEAIIRVTDMHVSPELFSLFSSKPDKAMQDIVKNFTSIDLSRFYILGSPSFIRDLGKLLVRSGSQHITVFSPHSEDNQALVAELNSWVKKVYTEKRPQIFHSPQSEKANYYYLSSADGIVVEDEDAVSSLDKNELSNFFKAGNEEIARFRFNEKKQIFMLFKESHLEWETTVRGQYFHFLVSESQGNFKVKEDDQPMMEFYEKKLAVAQSKLYEDYLTYANQ